MALAKARRELSSSPLLEMQAFFHTSDFFCFAELPVPLPFLLRGIHRVYLLKHASGYSLRLQEGVSVVHQAPWRANVHCDVGKRPGRTIP